MNTQKIRILLKAIELGSLSKAGAELGYTQSALTQMMRSLEDEVGFPLLDKTNKGVRPTAEAEILMPAMRQILRSEDQFEQEIASINGLHKGSITVGSFASASICWLPRVLEYFRDNYPEITFEIVECGQDEMAKGILDGSLDIALMSDPESDAMDFVPICVDPLLVVFSERYDLGSYRRIPGEVLRDYPFVVEQFDRDTYKVLEKCGLDPDIKYYSRDAIAILSMIRQGIGIGIVPKMIVDLYPGSCQTRKLDPEQFRTIGVGVRNINECGPLARLVIQYIKDNIS